MRRWLLPVAAVLIAAGAVLALEMAPRPPLPSVWPSNDATAGAPPAATPAPTPTAVPNGVPTEPPGPTLDPSSVAACTTDDLALAAGGWGGGTGSMAGGATVINVASGFCRVSGKPRLELRAKGGALIAMGSPALDGEAVVLPPGGISSVIVVWSNWCEPRPAGPLTLGVGPFGVDGMLDAEVVPWSNQAPDGGSVPRCDLQGAPSTIDAPVPFATPEAPEVGAGDPPCDRDDLVAYLGSWGAAAGTAYASVVVLNQTGDGCQLEGLPPLQLRDGNGMLVEHRADPASAPPIDLPAGRAAQAYLGFTDWCVPPPKLPFEFELVVGGRSLPMTPTSARSLIGVPACHSDPPAATPQLFLNDPFELPAI